MTKPKTPMSDEHKAAMSVGMIQANAVRRYLESLAEAPKRTTRTAAELQEMLLAADDPIERLKLRPLLRAALEAESEDRVGTKDKFIENCAGFSERHGITYADWREEGVPGVRPQRGWIVEGQVIRFNLEIVIGQADERLTTLVEILSDLNNYMVETGVGFTMTEDRDPIPPDEVS